MRDALVIIDVQRAFFDDAPRAFEADAVVDRINALSARARAAEVPVIVVQHEAEGDNVVHGTEGWGLARRLVSTGADHMVRKTTPDSFLRTPLGELLGRLGTERLVVCGYASEYCVDTTVRRSAALGFPVIIASDAHTTHDKAHLSGLQIRAHHNATLPGIDSFGPVIAAVPSASIHFSSPPSR